MEVLLLLLLLGLRGLPDGESIGVLQDRVEALAVGQAVSIAQAEDCRRVRVLTAAAE